MKNWNTSQWIAFILAIVVFYVFGTKMLFHLMNPSLVATTESSAAWLDILKYIVGGLIGYMSREK